VYSATPGTQAATASGSASNNVQFHRMAWLLVN
jgi:hypothetical protein